MSKTTTLATASKIAKANRAVVPSVSTKTFKKKVSAKSTETTKTLKMSPTKIKSINKKIRKNSTATPKKIKIKKKLYPINETKDNMNKPSTNTDSNVNTNNKNDMNPIENIHTIVSETASTNEENLNNIPQTTYLTDEELEHFRDILLAHRNEVVEDLTILYSSLKSEDSAGFNTSYSQHMAEHGTDTLNKEQMFLFIQRDEKYLSYIDKALERIKNKTYGICVASGKPIPKSRLEAVPITAVRIEYKNK